MKNFTLECCVDTVEAAILAEQGGATRLELCANLIIGGTTPSEALFKTVRGETKIPINVMIRPRFGDFCYSEFEFEIILQEIEAFGKLGADGIVFGILTEDGSLDLKRMKAGISAAEKRSKTLHRAFDLTKDPIKALKEAEAMGINTILTSGQQAKAADGKALIRELVDCSGEIEILVGSGVDAAVIREIMPYTGATAYHMSGRIVEDSPMKYRKEGVPMGLSEISEYERFSCSPEKLAEAKKAILSLI